MSNLTEDDGWSPSFAPTSEDTPAVVFGRATLATLEQLHGALMARSRELIGQAQTHSARPKELSAFLHQLDEWQQALGSYQPAAEYCSCAGFPALNERLSTILAELTHLARQLIDLAQGSDELHRVFCDMQQMMQKSRENRERIIQSTNEMWHKTVSDVGTNSRKVHEEMNQRWQQWFTSSGSKAK